MRGVVHQHKMGIPGRLRAGQRLQYRAQAREIELAINVCIYRQKRRIAKLREGLGDAPGSLKSDRFSRILDVNAQMRTVAKVRFDLPA